MKVEQILLYATIAITIYLLVFPKSITSSTNLSENNNKKKGEPWH